MSLGGKGSWNDVHGSELTDGKMSVEGNGQMGSSRWDGMDRREGVCEREVADWKMSI
jgi:hypothetical protein